MKTMINSTLLTLDNYSSCNYLARVRLWSCYTLNVQYITRSGRSVHYVLRVKSDTRSYVIDTIYEYLTI